MIRNFLRSHGFGPWLFETFWAPTRPWGYGVTGSVQFIRGLRAMKRAASQLPPVRPGTGGPELAVTILTGNEYWFQSAFCAHSLANACEGRIRLRVCDDGTLRSRQARLLARIFPTATFVTHQDTEHALEAALPRTRFPLLRQARDKTPMLRKLVDLRSTSQAWQLSLDGDMLFFRPPEFLFDCQQSKSCCYMLDAVDGYIFPPEGLAQLAGRPVPPNMNAGLVALRDDEIDWEEVERWCRSFTPAQREHRLFEQSLTAILLSRMDAQPAPVGDYVIVHRPNDIRPPGATMAHYIIRGKLPYFTREWRDYLAGADKSFQFGKVATE